MRREPVSAERFVGIEEAAAFLGVKVSYLYELVRLGRAPSYKVGKFRRFRISELEVWVTRGSHAESELDNGSAAAVREVLRDIDRETP